MCRWEFTRKQVYTKPYFCSTNKQKTVLWHFVLTLRVFYLLTFSISKQMKMCMKWQLNTLKAFIEAIRLKQSVKTIRKLHTTPLCPRFLWMLLDCFKHICVFCHNELKWRIGTCNRYTTVNRSFHKRVVFIKQNYFSFSCLVEINYKKKSFWFMSFVIDGLYKKEYKSVLFYVQLLIHTWIFYWKYYKNFCLVWHELVSIIYGKALVLMSRYDKNNSNILPLFSSIYNIFISLHHTLFRPFCLAYLVFKTNGCLSRKDPLLFNNNNNNNRGRSDVSQEIKISCTILFHNFSSLELRPKINKFKLKHFLFSYTWDYNSFVLCTKLKPNRDIL